MGQYLVRKSVETPTRNGSDCGECDEEVLDELERIADFASIDEMRFPLLDFLAEEGDGARKYSFQDASRSPQREC